MRESKLVLQRGTSLVELLVAVVFLAVCAVPLLSMVVSSQVRSNEASSRAIALALAQDEIEGQRTSAQNVRPTVGTVTNTYPHLPGMRHPAKVKVITSAVPGVPNTFQISVRVEYDDKLSNVTLTTLVKSKT